MVFDYYQVLNVRRTATDQELTASYKTLARKWNPANYHSPSCKNDALTKLNQVTKAFSVLIDPETRENYDRGLGVPDKEYLLFCTLEELFTGTTKKKTIARTVKDITGIEALEEEILTVDIKPGSTNGTKIRFTEKGDRAPNIIPGDVVLIIEEKPHEHYERDGNDLVYNKKIPLVDALTGFTLDIPTLDERKLTYEVGNVFKPGKVLKFDEQGMPIANEPGKRGNLWINFVIEYPSSDLTEEQKSVLRRIFNELDSYSSNHSMN